MDLYLVGTFILTSLLLFATPGPDMLAMLGRGISQGRQAAIVTVIGYALGDLIHTTFAVIGLSAIIYSSSILFQIVKYIGALYLIYLGIQTIRHRHQFKLSSESKKIKNGKILRESILSSVLNPKTTLFFLAFLPQFVDADAGNVQIQMLVLGAIFMMLGILAYFPLAYFSGLVGTWIQTRKAVADKLHLITGSIFIGLGIRIALPAKSS